MDEFENEIEEEIYMDNLVKFGLEEDEEIFQRFLEEKEESTEVEKGRVKFKEVNHSARAAKFGRMSDGNTASFLNVVLDYFDNRCALSGEKFESFGRGKVQNSSAKSNLSAEHIVPLCQGGDDVVPNLVPSVLQYNISKNGYNLLDWWGKQKDKNGKDLYSPYRLLKLVNYMLKSEEARKQGIREAKDVRKFRKILLTPNEIDKFLETIVEQDKIEEDNGKRKILSDTITATTKDEDGKKYLTQIPNIEENIPQLREQEIDINRDIHMMDIFILDAIGELKKDSEISQIKLQNKEGQEVGITDILDEMFKQVKGTIPFEIEVRNMVLERIQGLGIEDNLYTVSNGLILGTDIIKFARDNEQDKGKIGEYISSYFDERMHAIVEKTGLPEQEAKVAVINAPAILYNDEIIDTLNLYRKYISEEVNYDILDRVYLENILKIKEWMEKNETIRPPRSAIYENGKIKLQENLTKSEKEERNLGIALSRIRQERVKPYEALTTKAEKEEYKRMHPELEEVMKIIEEIDRNNIPIYLQNALAIKEWIKKNKTTKPPRSDIRENGKSKPKENQIESEKEEIKLGNALANIRFFLIKPYTVLTTETERKEYKRNHPELEEVMQIVEEIDKNNIRLKEESPYYQNVLAIKEWMERNETTKPPKQAIWENKELKQKEKLTESEKEEIKLGNALVSIRSSLIKPYTVLTTEAEREEYKRNHPELEEVMQIVEEIDKNNIPIYLQNAKAIQEWMKRNETIHQPRCNINKNDKSKLTENELEEVRLGNALRNIRNYLIKPYEALTTKAEREEYKRIHPELEEVMQIVEEIDKNNIPIYLQNVKLIKEWMEKNKTTKPPRPNIKENSKIKLRENLTENEQEEVKLGTALGSIRQQLIKPYEVLTTEAEREEYKRNHPELEEVMQIVEEIDKNNIPIYLQNAKAIQEWMKKNETTKQPRKRISENGEIKPKEYLTESEQEEVTLGRALSTIREKLIKPYTILTIETEREEYKLNHPELEEVMQIVEEIDNYIRPKEESPYYQNVLSIQEWMERNETTKPPRSSIIEKRKRKPKESLTENEKEEVTLGQALGSIRQQLIKPYEALTTEAERKEYKRIHPELEEVMQIVEEIDKNKKIKKSNLKKVVAEQKDHLVENVKIENEFEKTIQKTEHNLEEDRQEK